MMDNWQQQLINIYGQENFTNMMQQLQNMSEQDKQVLFQKIQSMPKEYFIQYFQAKGFDISPYMKQDKVEQPTNRTFNY